MPNDPSKERLLSLPFPLRHSRNIYSLDPTSLFTEGKDFFGDGSHKNKKGVSPHADVSIVDIGALRVLATRTTPCISTEQGEGFSTFSMSYAGDVHQYRDGRTIQTIEPGDTHLSPRSGGVADLGHFSGIICQIDHKRLRRTINTVSGKEQEINLAEPRVFKGSSAGKESTAARHLWSYLSYVDQVLTESNDLAAGLGLDDQIYRLLALSLIQATGDLERVKQRWRSANRTWNNALDELVDYIRANAHLNLTLTDLEEQSHFSGRRLQYLFKERFECTPMQFVRRERLSTAMERLQTASPHTTVTQIARECGYRFTSNFTTDFQREFGITPSVVLRTSQRGRD